MDDKSEKRRQLIKKYNQDLSNEIIEKKLLQMENPEDYKKEIQNDIKKKWI